MLIFENGQLIKDAYVVINNVEHPVVMPEYSGNTPLEADNLNRIQKSIVIPVTISAGTTITNGYTIEWTKGYNYVCGSGDLKVFWNGMLLKKATDTEDGHYIEGDDDGEECGFIKMHRTIDDGNYTLNEDVLVLIVIQGG